MNIKLTSSFIIAVLLLTSLKGHAQAVDEKAPEELLLQLEFRPRTEFRDGYRVLRSDTSSAALFTSQRTRLSLTVTQPTFTFHTSVQDIRVWGEADPRSTKGTLQVFEAYVEPRLADRFSLRIGRQTLMYDNQRLFAQNDWRQNARSHDALRLRYQAERLSSDLVLAFNQTEERLFGTNFSPEGFTDYKFLAVSYLQYQTGHQLTYMALNVADGFQNQLRPEQMHLRYTHGGRVEYTGDHMYYTLSAYYQHGVSPAGVPVAAYYIQPEVRATYGILTARLGAELLSGNTPGNTTANKDHSFVPLYGVAHRFNGFMDYFTRFPTDTNDAGLINPYLFLLFKLSAQWSLRSDCHLFYAQQAVAVNTSQDCYRQYLGFENDLVASWTPNTYTTLDIGAAWMQATPSMEVIQNGGNSKLTPYWGYVMFTFKPELLRLSLRKA